MDDLGVWRAAHVAGAVLLVGNVTVTGFWATFLYRARAAVPFRPVARAIMWADVLFTLFGGALLTISGIMLVRARGYRVLETPWLLRGIALLGAATLLWLVVLLPVQWRLERLRPEDEPALQTLFRRWSIVGWGATLLLFYGLWGMVTKQ